MPILTTLTGKLKYGKTRIDRDPLVRVVVTVLVLTWMIGPIHPTLS
jgi:hypothetical protein